MSDAAKVLGARVRTVRKLRAQTMAQLATGLGVSEEWVRRIESGTGRASLETIEALASQLKVPIADLFTLPEEASSGVISIDVADWNDEDRQWLERLIRLAADRPGRAEP